MHLYQYRTKILNVSVGVANGPDSKRETVKLKNEPPEGGKEAFL